MAGNGAHDGRDAGEFHEGDEVVITYTGKRAVVLRTTGSTVVVRSAIGKTLYLRIDQIRKAE